MTHLFSNIVPFRCAECSAEFSPSRGGHCERCGRLLCARHLFGPRKIFQFKPLQRICPRCQAALSEAGADTKVDGSGG